MNALKLNKSKELRKYQSDAIESLLSNLPNKPCLLGFSTGTGKTYTTHELIECWMVLNPNKRVLVLTHNQTILRDNFSRGSDFMEFKVGSTLTEAKSKRVVVSIPSTLKDKDLGKFGLLVIDEAHEWFGQTSIKNIRSKIGTHQLLLLTASHGKFSNSEYHKILFSIEEGIEHNFLSDVKIEIVESAWNFDETKDYNNDLELKGTVKVSSSQVERTCKDLLAYMGRSQSWIPGFTKIDRKVLISFEKIKALKVLPKTIVVCHNTNMADSVYEYMRSQFADQVSISYSKTDQGKYPDVNSENLKAFKDSSQARMLILVKRGVLGFDVPELEYVFDMTASKNVGRTQQIMGRVMRQSGKLKKHYFKVSPIKNLEYTNIQMACVVALMKKEINETWDGTSDNIPLLKVKEKRLKSIKDSTKAPNISKKAKSVVIDKYLMEFAQYKSVFDSVNNQGPNSVFHSRLFCTAKEAIQRMESYIGNGASEKNKGDIIQFFKDNGRWPSNKRDNSHESFIGARLTDYIVEGLPCYDRNFKETVISMGYLFRDDKRLAAKNEIRDFVKKNKRLPALSIAEEKVLAKRMHRFFAPSEKSFDPQFRGEFEVYINGTKKAVNTKKEVLLKLIKNTGKIPKEARGYLSKANESFDPGFRNSVKKLVKIKDHFNLRKKRKAEVIKFIKINKGLPLQRFSDPQERALAWAVDNYASPSKKHYDPEFRQKLIDLGALKPKEK